MSPEKGPSWKGNYIFQPSIFRGYTVYTAVLQKTKTPSQAIWPSVGMAWHVASSAPVTQIDQSQRMECVFLPLPWSWVFSGTSGTKTTKTKHMIVSDKKQTLGDTIHQQTLGGITQEIQHPQFSSRLRDSEYLTIAKSSQLIRDTTCSCVSLFTPCPSTLLQWAEHMDQAKVSEMSWAWSPEKSLGCRWCRWREHLQMESPIVHDLRRHKMCVFLLHFFSCWKWTKMRDL